LKITGHKSGHSTRGCFLITPIDKKSRETENPLKPWLLWAEKGH